MANLCEAKKMNITHFRHKNAVKCNQKKNPRIIKGNIVLGQNYMPSPESQNERRTKKKSARFMAWQACASVLSLCVFICRTV